MKILNRHCQKVPVFRINEQIDTHRVDAAVLRIRMFLGVLDPEPDPLVRGTDPAPTPDPSINKQPQK
jgi:hypothetical protein